MLSLAAWTLAWAPAPARAAAGDPQSVSIELGAAPVEAGMTARAGDGATGLQTGELDGRTYWKTNKSQDENSRIIYFYFDVDDGFTENIANYDVDVSVDYYDAGSGKMVLQYDAQGANNSFKDAPLYAYGDTGSWQTHAYRLTDANFADRTGGGDFRLGIEGGAASWSTNADLSVAKVTVTKTLKAAPADQVGITFGASPIEQGITARAGDNPDGLVTGALNGKGYWQTNKAAPGDRTLYVYLSVDDGYLYDVQDQDVYVTVEYLDRGNGSFVLQYDALSAPFKDSPLFAYKDSGQWKTHTFKLSDAKFANRTNGADLRIGISGGGNPDDNPDLAVASVTISKQERLSADAQPKVYVPKNPADDVVIADFSVKDFGAKGDGTTDDTAAIQSALTAAGNNGGGVVFAPAGHYRVNGSLTVPTGVTLRGDWASPDDTGGAVTGTVLDAYGGKGQADGPSFIQLQPVSGVTNLSVWYPEQSLDQPAAYPWTFEQLSGDSATMANITLVNAYNGIKIGPVWNELHYVKNLYGTALHTGIFLDYTTDIGRLEGIHLSPSYWSGSGLAGAPAADALRAYSTASAEGIVMGRSDWEYMSDIHISGYKTGMRVTTRTDSLETANAQLYRIQIEDCNVALKIEGVNDFGLLITDSSFQASAGEAPVAIHATPGFHSIVQFNTVTVGGAPLTAVKSEGNGVLSFENSRFENWDAASGGYAIDLSGGSLTLGQSDFAKAENQVRLTGAVQTVNAVNSGYQGSLNVKDESDGAEVNATQDARYALETLPAVGETDAAVRPKPATSELFDVTAEPYQADRSGGSDASAAIQQALDAASAAGGGTVYLPAGTYRVNAPLTVPSGVELRGSWDVPHHTIGGGTVLFTTYGEDAADDAPGLITLMAGAGTRGLSVYYDEQDWNDVKPYAWTIQGQGHGVYAIDTTLINSYRGIDFGTYDTSGHYIDYVAGSPLKEGIFLGGGASGGFMRNVQFNPHYYGRNNYVNHPSTDADFNAVWTYQKDHLDAFRLGHVTDETVFNTFVYGSQYGIHFVKQGGSGPEAVVIGHGTDGSKKGAYLEGAGEAGLSLINTELVSLSTTDKVYVTLGEDFDSKATLYNSSMWGDTTRSFDVYGGKLNVQQANLTNVGETGLNALGGDIALYDSYFQQPRTTHVYAAPGIDKLILTNNLFKGGLQLVNEAGTKVSGTNLAPLAIGLETLPPDPAHADRAGARLSLMNVSDPEPLGGKLELLQPAPYAAAAVPIRFSGIAYGEEQVIDLPAMAADSLKYKVTLDNGASYAASVKSGQAYASRKDAGAADAPTIDVSALDEFGGGAWGGPNGLSAKANVAWDDEKLYVNVDVTDDVQAQSFKGGDIWQGDSIQIGLDLSRQDGAGSRSVSELGFALNDDGSVQKWRWKAPGGLAAGALDASAEAAVTRDDDARVTHYAIALPFAILHGPGAAFDPGAGPLGFSLLLNENDGAGRAGYMEFNQGIGTSKDFTLYGDLYLLNAPFGDWAVPAAEAAVNKAKADRDATSIDAARNFVNLLPEGADRTALTAQLDALDNGNGNGSGNGSGNGNGNGNGNGSGNGNDNGNNGSAVVLPLTSSLDAAGKLATAAVGEAALKQALADAKPGQDGKRRVRAEVSAAQGAAGYAVAWPSSAFDGDTKRILEMKTPQGTITVSADMFGADKPQGDTITFVLKAADGSAWSDGSAGGSSGGRPAVELYAFSSGAAQSRAIAAVPAAVSVPYEPAAQEAPGRLVIRYIDSSGSAVPVPSGKYDAAAKQMTFRAAHFGTYAVAYAASASFGDLAGAPWAREAVDALAARGIARGVSADAFAPGRAVTRADFLLLLVRTLELHAPAGGAQGAAFADVPAGAYYADAARIASALGIASGTGDGRFRSDAPISRQDAAALAERAFRAAGRTLPAGADDALAGFIDAADVAGYARSSVEALLAAGLLQGSGGKLNPRESLTRAESAVLLYRLYMS
ncbi:glycosyl hydrolase family 28-related protein [Paenibacillus sp. GCM10023250]|uniref:glycosyl hydrolase family 28-related protein n=1 Tax=Paenibacillus sp. GCM10023250 TaxID=3252648 RepID=UPI00360CBF32